MVNRLSSRIFDNPDNSGTPLSTASKHNMTYFYFVMFHDSRNVYPVRGELVEPHMSFDRLRTNGGDSNMTK
jgi:hypothetical protein